MEHGWVKFVWVAVEIDNRAAEPGSKKVGPVKGRVGKQLVDKGVFCPADIHKRHAQCRDHGFRIKAARMGAGEDNRGRIRFWRRKGERRVQAVRTRRHSFINP